LAVGIAVQVTALCKSKRHCVCEAGNCVWPLCMFAAKLQDF